MTTTRRRKAAITLTAAEAASLTALLTTIDAFLRSSPAVTAGLAEFLRARGAGFPGFEACNLIDELSFTALGYRNRLAGGDGTDPIRRPDDLTLATGRSPARSRSGPLLR